MAAKTVGTEVGTIAFISMYGQGGPNLCRTGDSPRASRWRPTDCHEEGCACAWNARPDEPVHYDLEHAPDGVLEQPEGQRFDPIRPRIDARDDRCDDPTIDQASVSASPDHRANFRHRGHCLGATKIHRHPLRPCSDHLLEHLRANQHARGVPGLARRVRDRRQATGRGFHSFPTRPARFVAETQTIQPDRTEQRWHGAIATRGD
jgi:hypothetical protein